MTEIMVIAEQRQGELREITFELTTLAVTIARERGLKASVCMLGHETATMKEELLKTGCQVLHLNDENLKYYNADHYLEVIENVIKDRQPQLVLAGHTAMGMDLAPALAARADLPIITDCTEVTVADQHVDVTRQVYGGKVIEQITTKDAGPIIITVRAGSYSADQSSTGTGSITELSLPDWTKLRGRKFIEYLEAELEDVDIADADILISVGRGVGKEENITQIQELADAIGATVACSRPVADKNWLPKSRQVGTSGKTVKPKIYLALGISGAFQHEAGMRNAETIIAVNTDPKAPIFNVAHYGIVADMFQVIPQLKSIFQKS